MAALVPLSRIGMSGITDSASWIAEAITCPLSGVAAWLVWRRVDIGLERKRAALRRWGWVLLLCAFWPLAAAGHGGPLAATSTAATLAGAAVVTISFRRLRPGALPFLLPFVAWMLLDAAMLTTRF